MKNLLASPNSGKYRLNLLRNPHLPSILVKMNTVAKQNQLIQGKDYILVWVEQFLRERNVLDPTRKSEAVGILHYSCSLMNISRQLINSICRTYFHLIVEKMKTHIYRKVLFFDTLQDLASTKPYVILSIPEATSLTSKFEAFGKLTGDNLEIGSTFDIVNAKLDAGILWCSAIYIAMHDGYFPNIVLPLTEYQAAMAALNLGN